MKDRTAPAPQIAAIHLLASGIKPASGNSASQSPAIATRDNNSPTAANSSLCFCRRDSRVVAECIVRSSFRDICCQNNIRPFDLYQSIYIKQPLVVQTFLPSVALASEG